MYTCAFVSGYDYDTGKYITKKVLDVNKVLIVVDMQNDFIFGPLGTREARKIIPSVKNKIDEHVKMKSHIFFTRDTHYNGYLNTQEGKNLPIEHCIFGTNGWHIFDGLDDNCEDCYYINKLSFSPINYWENHFLNDIKKISEIELIGVCTDICVLSNAIALKSLYPEIKITVDALCCAGTTPEMHKKALDVMKSCQVNILPF